MLKCNECHIEKEESEFPLKKKEICKKCRKRQIETKYKQSEKGRKVQDRYNHSDKKKIVEKKYNEKRIEEGYFRERYKASADLREKENERRKKHHKENPELKRACERRHKEAQREKYLARARFSQAVAKGKIIRPKICEACNKEDELS